MRVVRVDDSVRPPSQIRDIAPRPRPGRGELLIGVVAAGVILTKPSWYSTFHRPMGERRIGAIPAHEFSGVVAAVGEDVRDLEIGREVFSINDWYRDGAPGLVFIGDRKQILKETSLCGILLNAS
jgi:NADPH:quinone reductase-like Zn-dependent oxidoreductase